MDFPLLLRGALLGFSIAATFGPISLLCVRRTAVFGFRVGLLSGLGVASADATYAAIAAFGLTAFTSVLVAVAPALRIVGGAFLVWLGVRMALAPAPDLSSATRPAGGAAGSYGTLYLLTLANPMTILAFVAIFAGLGLVSSNGDPLSATALVLGVFAGSTAWWLVLTTAVTLLRARLTAGAMRVAGVFTGLVITVFGVQALASAFA